MSFSKPVNPNQPPEGVTLQKKFRWRQKILNM